MSALYLGVVVLPLVVLVWNLGPGGRFRRETRGADAPESAPSTNPRFGRVRRLLAVPGAFVSGFRAALPRSAASASAEPASAFEPSPSALQLAPDAPRSPSSPGWVPASGYAARPRA